MATTTINAYFIECITNMHTGSGDANYGVVDKLVQRDPVTRYPTIHSSSLKGALREHFESLWGKNSDSVNEVFGREALQGKESESGSYKFLGADLVALPVRSNFKQFSLALSPEMVSETNYKCQLLTGRKVFKVGEKVDTLYTKTMSDYQVYFEDEVVKTAEHSPLLECSGIECFDDRYTIMEKTKFAGFIENLPVIARNQLDNGISKNLWYEEIVPHQSVFITFIISSDSYFTEFEEGLTGNGRTVQIGGNASVGYGICKFHKISSK